MKTPNVYEVIEAEVARLKAELADALHQAEALDRCCARQREDIERMRQHPLAAENARLRAACETAYATLISVEGGRALPNGASIHMAIAELRAALKGGS